MLRKLLSEPTHYILSILIPLMIAIWYDAAASGIILAIACGWIICLLDESIIQRWSLIPLPTFFMNEVATRHGLILAFFIFAFFFAYDMNLSTASIEMMQILALSALSGVILTWIYVYGSRQLAKSREASLPQ